MKYILAADDDEINRNILEEILSDDYEISLVENGIECMESIAKRIPDLLLLDVSMPEMNGLEVCSRLRENNDTKNLPILMLSGFASEESINNAIAVGATYYLTKPFMPDELAKLISKYI